MKKLVIAVFSIAVFAAIGVSLYMVYMSIPQIGYVDLKNLHDEFEMKKELGVELEKVKLKKQATLDSLKLDFEIASRQGAGKDVLLQKQQVYSLKQSQFDEEVRAFEASGEQRMWNQLNLYVQEYGKKKGKSLIVGLSGNGNVMYANTKYDLTAELIKYSNDIYNGGSIK